MTIFRSVNPADNLLLAEFPTFSAAQLEQALNRSEKAFAHWRQEAFAQRETALRRLAERLSAQRQEFARLMAMEMGKPLSQGLAELDKSARTCMWFAAHGAALLEEEFVAYEEHTASVRFDPLGPLLAIMPWNFPFWQVIRFCAPALLAGNVILLKHAPNVPQCALAIRQLFREAGFPEGVLEVIFADNAQVEGLLADARICGATLTGSTRAGRAVAAAAGANLKKCVLELGGSDAWVVLKDADLNAAAQTAAASRMQNAGQTCVAAKRLIVEAPVYDDFVQLFRDKLSAYAPADPLREDTRLGPMARLDLRESLQQQVRQALNSRASVLLDGGAPAEAEGCWFSPMLLGGLSPESPVSREEFFGPVGLIYRAETPEEAVQLANRSPYGLGATLWTRDEALAERLIPQLEAGSVAVNGAVQSDPRLPFGGIKNSGFGRELSAYGMKEFVNIKSVVRYTT